MGAMSYEDVDAWKYGHAVALRVYHWTRGFPKEELYGLVTQLRRAAASGPTNIAEGFARRMPRDKARIYNIAEASAEELGYLVRLSRELNFGEDPGDLPAMVKSTSRLTRKLVDATLARARASAPPSR